VGVSTNQNTLFGFQEKYGGGNLKNESRDGFSGGVQRVLARAGAGAEFQHFILNLFELWSTKPP
jgi:hypothetical protein